MGLAEGRNAVVLIAPSEGTAMSISRRLAAHRQAIASAGGEAAEIDPANPELPGDDAEENTTTSTTEKDKDMTNTVNATAVAEAVAAERTRTNTVLASEHYTGREALAAELLASDLPADTITKALAKAPAVAAAAATAGDPDAAARAEMKEAIAANQNSAIEPGAAGVGAGDATLDAKQAAAVWDTAINNEFPKARV